MEVSLRGLVFLIDEKDLPRKFTEEDEDALFEFDSPYFTIKEINGPLVNGVIAITIELKVNKNGNNVYAYYMSDTDFIRRVKQQFRTLLK